MPASHSTRRCDLDKISRILPSGPRLRAVDLTDAHPVRPGVPAFGRPVGMTSSQRLNDTLSISEKAREVMQNETMSGRNPKDAAGAKIADRLSQAFFQARTSELPSLPALADDEPLPALGARETATLDEDSSTATVGSGEVSEVSSEGAESANSKALELGPSSSPLDPE